MGRTAAAVLPKHDSGTYQIKVNPTQDGSPCSMFRTIRSTFDFVGVTDDGGLRDDGVFCEDVLDLGRAQPVPAHVYHVVHAAGDLRGGRGIGVTLPRYTWRYRIGQAKMRHLLKL